MDIYRRDMEVLLGIVNGLAQKIGEAMEKKPSVCVYSLHIGDALRLTVQCPPDQFDKYIAKVREEAMAMFKALPFEIKPMDIDELEDIAYA